MLGFGFGFAARRRGGPFHPAQLFAAGEQGLWFDPSEPGTLFEDSAGTIAAVVDGPVGRIADKSGRGNHAVQANAASRPLLRQDGDGRRYLEFDGTDDALRALFPIAQPYDRMSGLRLLSSDGASRHAFGGGTAHGGLLFHHAPVPSLSIASSITAATRTDFPVGVTAVISERFDGAGSRLAVNAAAATTGNPGATASGGMTLGGRFDGASAGASRMRLYGVVVRAGRLSDARLAQLRLWLAGKAGVTL
jgi:hypothetical protein